MVSIIGTPLPNERINCSPVQILSYPLQLPRMKIKNNRHMNWTKFITLCIISWCHTPWQGAHAYYSKVNVQMYFSSHNKNCTSHQLNILQIRKINHLKRRSVKSITRSYYTIRTQLNAVSVCHPRAIPVLVFTLIVMKPNRLYDKINLIPIFKHAKFLFSNLLLSNTNCHVIEPISIH